MTAKSRDPDALHNRDAELAVLGTLIRESIIALPLVRGNLDPEDFADPIHKGIVKAILALAARGDPIDLLMVNTELCNTGLHDNLGLTGLQDLMDHVPIGATVEHVCGHLDRVRQKAYRRRLKAAAQELVTSCTNGGDPAEVLQQVIAIRPPSAVTDLFVKAFLAQPALEVADLPTPEPILGDGLLVRGDYGVLLGPKGSGKSWLTMELAAKVSLGEPFFGLTTQQVPVLIWSLELTRDRLRGRLRAMGYGAKCTLPELYLFGKDSLSCQPGTEGVSPIPRLAVQADQERVLQVVLKFAPGLVIIDPLGPAVAVSENEELAGIARFLLVLAAQANCSVLVCHHPRKSSPGDKSGDGIHELRGPSQLGDWASAAMILKPVRGAWLLKCSADPRHCQAPPELWLTRTDEGPFATTEEPASLAAKADERRRTLLEALQERGSLTIRDACELIGTKQQAAINHLKKIGAQMVGRGPVAKWVLGESSTMQGVDDRVDDRVDDPGELFD